MASSELPWKHLTDRKTMLIEDVGALFMVMENLVQVCTDF